LKKKIVKILYFLLLYYDMCPLSLTHTHRIGGYAPPAIPDFFLFDTDFVFDTGLAAVPL
jgi:hypothetical protein